MFWGCLCNDTCVLGINPSSVSALPPAASLGNTQKQDFLLSLSLFLSLQLHPYVA